MISTRLVGALFILSGVGSLHAVETTRTQIGSQATGTTHSEAMDRDKAREWGLTLAEFRRSQALLHGFTGSVADARITPIEVLGIHARDESERDKYAEKFARFMFDYAERAMRFEIAYQRVAKRLFPTLPVVEVDPRSRLRPSLEQVLLRAPSDRPQEARPALINQTQRPTSTR